MKEKTKSAQDKPAPAKEKPAPVKRTFKERLLRKLDLATTIFGLLSIAMTIIYLSFLLIVGIGNFYVNLASLAVAIFYAVFLFIFVFIRNGGLAKKIGKKSYKYIKLIISAASLALSIYGLVVSASNPTFWSIALVVLFAVILYIKIVLEIVSLIVTAKVKKILKKRKAAKLAAAKQPNAASAKTQPVLDDDDEYDYEEADE